MHQTTGIVLPIPAKECSVTRLREVYGPSDENTARRQLYFGAVTVPPGRTRGLDFGSLECVAILISGSAGLSWNDQNTHISAAPEGCWALRTGPCTTFRIEACAEPAEAILVRAESVLHDEQTHAELQGPVPSHWLRPSWSRIIVSQQRAIQGATDAITLPWAGQGTCEGLMHVRFSSGSGYAVVTDLGVRAYHGDTVIIPVDAHEIRVSVSEDATLVFAGVLL